MIAYVHTDPSGSSSFRNRDHAPNSISQTLKHVDHGHLSREKEYVQWLVRPRWRKRSTTEQYQRMLSAAHTQHFLPPFHGVHAASHISGENYAYIMFAATSSPSTGDGHV